MNPDITITSTPLPDYAAYQLRNMLPAEILVDKPCFFKHDGKRWTSVLISTVPTNGGFSTVALAWVILNKQLHIASGQRDNKEITDESEFKSAVVNALAAHLGLTLFTRQAMVDEHHELHARTELAKMTESPASTAQ